MSFSSSLLIKTEGMYFCIHQLRIGQVLLQLTEMCSSTARLSTCHATWQSNTEGS